MQLLAEKNITIQRPVSEVYAYVTNMERFGEWFPGVLAIESANDLDHGQAGKEYLETATIPLRGTRKIKVAVRETQVDKWFMTEGALPPLLPRMEVVFNEGDAGACDLTWRMFSRSTQPLVKWLLLPLARRVLAKRAAIALARLKHRLENAQSKEYEEGIVPAAMSDAP